MRSRLMGAAIVMAAVLLASSHPAAARSGSQLSLVQGLPGVTIDLVAGGDVIADDVASGSIVGLDELAGVRLADLTVVSSDTDELLVGPVAAFDVPATGDWSIVAHLDDSGDPTLTTFRNDVSEVDAGSVRFTFRHVAHGPPVDVAVGDARPALNIASGLAASFTLPSGELADAHLAVRGGPVLLDLPRLGLRADTTTIVYAIGSVEDGALDFLVQTITLDTEPGSATTTTTVASLAPTVVNTGAPLPDGPGSLAALVAVGGLVVAGAAWYARRRI